MQYHHISYGQTRDFCIKVFRGYGFSPEESTQITDVLLDGTQLLFVGDEDTIRQAFNIRGEDENCAFLPKILSRKKQVIPMLSALWG